MLPGTVGLCWHGAVGTHPLLGAGKGHSLAPSEPPWVGHREQRGVRGIVQVAKDSHVLLTQVGTRLGAGAMGKHTCLGGCSGIPSHARWLNSEIPAQIRPRFAPAPLHAPASPCAGDSPCGPQNLPASCCPMQKAGG